MTVLACTLAVALVVTVALFLRHISQRELEVRLERATLLNRIQRPDAAVTQSISDLLPPLEGSPYVPYDDDEAFNLAQLERN